MKRHPSWEAWSAWVDGESTDTEAMRRHLEQCAACTVQVKEIETLVSEVHRLPALEVHPAFVTRVMAHVAETTPERRPWWQRLVAPAAVAAALLILAVGSGFWRTIPAGSHTPDRSASPMVKRLAEAMVGYAEAAHDGEVWELGMADSVTPDELVAGIAQTEAFASLAKTCDDETDLDSLVTSLDEGEIAAFHGFVREYARENETL